MINKLQKEIAEMNANYPEVGSEIQKHKVKIQKKESCLEALELFLENINLLDRYKLNDFSPSTYNGSIEIKGVKISVEPDVIIRGEYRSKKYCGAVKLYFSKLNKLTADMGKTISSMVYEHLKLFDDNADSKHCFVYDVINSTIYSASGSYSKRIKEIEMTCEDIQALWPAIQPK
ncbi:hypothetical protein [Hymenobacter terrenus]|uniref:hypothetical protein n=1 Tax=Hymenobacter terrenus TaxID=1629124 RepID=UPI00061A03B3|nr:hypothetical protein [Hymenobacter terrenus]